MSLPVSRTDQTRIMQNHEERILALERSPGSAVYTDDRIITSPVDVITFTEFPAKSIMELTWEIVTSADGSDTSWIYMAFAGDYPVTANDYRWRLFGNVTADEGEPANFNFAAALGGSAISDEYYASPNWGRIRFPDFDELTGAHGVIWQGEGGNYDGNLPSTWLIAGCGDPATPLTEINVFAALASSSAPDATQIIAPSRVTLTCY